MFDWFWFCYCLFSKNNEPSPAPTRAVPAQSVSAPSTNTPKQTAPKQIIVADNAFTVYTKEAYPKIYAQYGNEGLKAFTEHDDEASFVVANSPECDKVEYVGYSEQRSNYPTKLVSFVDCANNKRFYVSNGQISEITKRY